MRPISSQDLYPVQDFTFWVYLPAEDLVADIFCVFTYVKLLIFFRCEAGVENSLCLHWLKIQLMTLLLNSMWLNFDHFPLFLRSFTSHRAFFALASSVTYSEICQNFANSVARYKTPPLVPPKMTILVKEGISNFYILYNLKT